MWLHFARRPLLYDNNTNHLLLQLCITMMYLLINSTTTGKQHPLIRLNPSQQQLQDSVASPATLLVNLLAKIREGEVPVAGWPAFFLPQIPRIILALSLRRIVLTSSQNLLLLFNGLSTMTYFASGFCSQFPFGLVFISPVSAFNPCFP